jgi:hypothetical protein
MNLKLYGDYTHEQLDTVRNDDVYSFVYHDQEGSLLIGASLLFIYDGHGNLIATLILTGYTGRGAVWTVVWKE